ncbi:hypothetical protein G6F22_016040 [Rhizopus arrhizus]|nr:hypothetical protein G6F22_016040 [Rhizopus arrhizus]
MPTACQPCVVTVTPGWSSATAARQGSPAPFQPLTIAWLSAAAPEHHPFKPLTMTPPAAWARMPTRMSGGSAHQTPQQASSGASTRACSSARMASASVCPSNNLAKPRSTAATAASARQRSKVPPEPGNGNPPKPARTSSPSQWPGSTGGRAPARTSWIVWPGDSGEIERASRVGMARTVA